MSLNIIPIITKIMAEDKISKELPVKYTKLFIDNEWVDASSGKTFPVLNPSTGKEICHIAEADKNDVDLAVDAASKAFALGSPWRRMDQSARGKLLQKFTELVRRDLDSIAVLECLDNGKPYEDAKVDVGYTIDVIDYYAGWCDKIHGKTIPVDGDFFTYTRVEPVGVCGAIIPWNYPLMMIAWKLGPALASGNTVVLKPAEQTPLTALYAASLFKEAGFPPGVVNVLPGYGPTAGAAIASHMKVDKVAFTGSIEIGQLVSAMAAKSNLKSVTLELGGKSPLVIFPDCGLDEAVEVAHNAIFANMGENCCAGSRTFVHKDIYAEFVAKAAAAARERTLGDPFRADVDTGPLVSEEQRTRVMSLVESGCKEGAILECGGRSVDTMGGYFVEPTVFSGVLDSMRIAREEIFGPVQSILQFESLDEVIERCNATHYALAAGVLTKDLNTALKFSASVRAGTVWINCYDYLTPQTPFGGFKMSGHGKELGPYAIDEYCEIKTVTMKVSQ